MVSFQDSFRILFDHKAKPPPAQAKVAAGRSFIEPAARPIF
jgi:hypothetical protein